MVTATFTIGSEEWRPVVGFEGLYEVSSLGRVRSLPRLTAMKNGRARHTRGGLLAAAIGDRYSSVCLKHEGRSRTVRVHVLVAESFLGPRPEGYDVCHGNNDGHDNRLANLRYDTHRNNQRQMVADGRHGGKNDRACRNGHLRTEENTRWYHVGDGRRTRCCYDCIRERRAVA